MKPKTKGLILMLLGVLGIIFVCTIDIITKKPVNDITGPNSFIGFAIGGILIILGIRLLTKKA